jgi:hypothetical protein
MLKCVCIGVKNPYPEIKLGTIHPWVKGITNWSNKGPGPLQGGDNYNNVKMGWVISIFLLENH